MIEVTETHAKKFVELLGHGLVGGLGKQEPGKMCIEAAWCFALGLPHGDDPGCVMEPLRRLKIRLNDATWSSNDARAKGLKRLGLIQIGSKDTVDPKEFRDRVNLLRIQQLVPVRMRAAAHWQKKQEHKDKLEEAAKLCENAPSIENARKARDMALQVRADAADAAYAAAADAADAAYAAYAAAADAADAAYAAYAADAADAAAAADARDKVLADFADGVVQILIDMKAPGVKWLYLA